MKKYLPESRKDAVFTIGLFILTIILLFVPTKFKTQLFRNEVITTARVLEIDDSELKTHGIITTGSQMLKLKILSSKFEGREVEAENRLFGKLEFDKRFRAGDKVLVSMSVKDNKITVARAVDHYRLNLILVVSLLFFAFLVFFSGWTGIKSALTFVFTASVIWKILLPSFLSGYNPILISFIVVMILTAGIIFSIGGLTRKGLVAFCGAASGVLLTTILAIIFGKAFKIHGAVQSFSETLLYSGYPWLNLSSIFLAGIFMASSGAVMDIAMDISASMNEVLEKHRDIPFKDLTRSGMEVGKAVIGTMTTTLLLAYTGGFTGLLMIVIAKRMPMIKIVNLQYIAAEILHTLVGSFGLVLVAPLTALIGGFIYTQHKK